jgi:hypothetical protein
MKLNAQHFKRAVSALALVSAAGALLIAQAASFGPPTRESKESMDPIYLNHFFLTLDPQTYKEVSESNFLKDEFATFEQRTTVRADTTYTGVYFYGTRTYFEFFEAGKNSGRAEGATGVASGIEARGGSDRLKERLESSLKSNVIKNTITRKTDDKDVPWFYSVGANFGDRTADFITWTMEYHEDFLNNWHPKLSPQTRGITRREILERYAAKLGENEKREQKYMDDVIEVRLALDEEDAARFVKEREAFGYKVTGDGVETTCEGPGIKYAVTRRTPNAVGITAIKLSLKRDKAGQKVYRFGRRSVLRFNDDRTATWTF